MLLPDNIHPENSIYYNGAMILKSLQANSKQSLMDLYYNVKSYNNIAFQLFILSLDWLYLLDAAKLNKKGEVELCS